MRRQIKRQINSSQLNELSKEQKIKLHKWWKPKTGDLCCCATIADEYDPVGCCIYPYHWVILDHPQDKEVCDALFEEVKKVL